MTIERARLSNRPFVTEFEPTEAPRTGGASTDKKKAPTAAAPLPQGAAALVRAHDQQTGGAARADAARRAISENARAVGEDPAAFAQRYAAPGYAGRSSAQIQSQARLDYVRDVLARRPDAADALIDARLRGTDPTTQALARAAVAQSGARGAQRYAACENALRALGGFDREARADVLGMVRAGERFDRAVAHEKKELARIAREEADTAASAAANRASPADLRQQALANAQARATHVNRITGQALRTLGRIGNLSPVAERAVGVGLGIGTVGSTVAAAGESVVTGSTRPLERAAQQAERAGAYVAGELSHKIEQAQQTGKQLLEASQRFDRLMARHKEAIRSGDFQEQARLGPELDAAEAEVRRHASKLAEQAKSIGKLGAHFDGDAEHAALNVLVFGAMSGTAQVPAVEHATHAATQAVASKVARVAGQRAGAVARVATDVAMHGAVEGGIGRTFEAVRH